MCPIYMAINYGWSYFRKFDQKVVKFNGIKPLYHGVGCTAATTTTKPLSPKQVGVG